MRALIVWLCLAAAPARADEVERVYHETVVVRKRLMLALTVGGAVSTLGGAALMVPDSDNGAWRVAGGVTLGFGVVNALIGGFAMKGISREEKLFQPDRRKLLADTEREAVVFGINVGLDLAYIMASAAAILASQLGVDDHERWLGGGVAGVVQGVFLAGIDVIGMQVARKAHARLLAW
jgi:hypothetical protein